VAEEAAVAEGDAGADEQPAPVADVPVTADAGEAPAE
jgi:hypothetical protein